MEEGNSGMPVISIIIPTKNRSEILLASLNKLMKATVFLTNFEVIIVDDGSDVLVNLPSDARNFKVVRNIGKGVASARNYGAGLAKSELLWFLDDDIWINEAALKRALHLNSTNSDAIFNFNWVYPPYLNEVISKIPFG
ncbi:MAG TPA: glycosyltransferase family 2 protein, partial [Bacteroidia bacterium]|nr:glycosyltransferase family 2 protein [Bacteroidia bacterium]